jgi:group I intron endonuclease
MAGVIYSINQISTNKIYIGLTSNYLRRKNEHLYELRSGNHYNPYLQAAWSKYGEEDFEFSVLLEVNNLEQLKEAEVRLIEEYNAINPNLGFNLSPGGDAAKWRAIKQYTKEGVFVKEYDTMSLAAASLGKLSTPIWKALNKKIPTAHGYQWRYSDQEQDIRTQIGNHDHKGVVIQYDLDNNWVAEYRSAMDAGRAIQHLTDAKSHRSVAVNIRKVCQGKMSHAYNFIWNYKK